MTILRQYITGAALAALLALSLAAWWGWQRVDALKADNAALNAQLRAERAITTLLRNEMESDRNVDAIADDGLAGAVDPRWVYEGDPR